MYLHTYFYIMKLQPQAEQSLQQELGMIQYKT